MAGVDRELLATYLRNRIEEEHLSLRKAAEQIKCSPATLSRLLSGNASQYAPDTATLTAIAKWLERNLSDFEPSHRPRQSSLAEVELHLHALPDISKADAQAIMAAVRALYEAKRERHPQ
jgi:transcriptional regulator with XRE-family HTH domain